MTKTHKIHKLPWAWQGDRRRKMSAVVDAQGYVVCGSLICQQSDKKMIETHKAIVDTMNKFYQKTNLKQPKRCKHCRRILKKGKCENYLSCPSLNIEHY